MIELKRAKECCVCKEVISKGTMCEFIQCGKRKQYYHINCLHELNDAIMKLNYLCKKYKYCGHCPMCFNCHHAKFPNQWLTKRGINND